MRVFEIKCILIKRDSNMNMYKIINAQHISKNYFYSVLIVITFYMSSYMIQQRCIASNMKWMFAFVRAKSLAHAITYRHGQKTVKFAVEIWNHSDNQPRQNFMEYVIRKIFPNKLAH